MISLRRKRGRTGRPKDFEVFYAVRAEGGQTWSRYHNGSEHPHMTGRQGWLATCPHGETCWSDSPGAFFCLGTLEQPAVFESGDIKLHQVMHIAYLDSLSRT